MCVYIGNVNDMMTVLFPLLDENVLYTTKWLDYQDLNQLVVNYLSTATTARLSSDRSLWAKTIMQGMNSTRTLYDYNLIPKQDVVNKYWLLGVFGRRGNHLVFVFSFGKQHSPSGGLQPEPEGKKKFSALFPNWATYSKFNGIKSYSS